MTRVYQTIVDKHKGNCMQAAVASLMDAKLEEVPNFVDFDSWSEPLSKFLRERNCEFYGMLHSGATVNKHSVANLPKHPGIDGIFLATVFSPMFYDESLPNHLRTTHAVLVDKSWDIVHDPNPLNAGITMYPDYGTLGYNGIFHVTLIKRL